MSQVTRYIISILGCREI